MSIMGVEAVTLINEVRMHKGTPQLESHWDMGQCPRSSLYNPLPNPVAYCHTCLALTLDPFSCLSMSPSLSSSMHLHDIYRRWHHRKSTLMKQERGTHKNSEANCPHVYVTRRRWKTSVGWWLMGRQYYTDPGGSVKKDPKMPIGIVRSLWVWRWSFPELINPPGPQMPL